MRFFHLSFRYKIPIWGGTLILLSVLVVSASLMFKAYEDLREDVRISAESLGGILTKTLFSPLLHDDVWRAFEQVNAVFHGGKTNNPIQPELIFVVSPVGHVMVSTAPETMPMLTSQTGEKSDRPKKEISFIPLSFWRMPFLMPCANQLSTAKMPRTVSTGNQTTLATANTATRHNFFG